MTLYSERKRLAALAERESAGESLWTTVIPMEARQKLVMVLDAVFNSNTYSLDYWSPLASRVRYARGVSRLASGGTPETDVKNALLGGELDLIADVLEVAAQDARWSEKVTAEVNNVLASYRVSFEVVGTMVVDFDSRTLHTQVVVPALTLLGGDAKYANVERAYQSALREIGAPGGAADAITDAGTALQEMLKSLGCAGKSLGPLLKSARTKGLLGPADHPLERSIAEAVDWVAADRSTTGDAHNAAPASREDAWLSVHIVGALILRLATGDPRGTSSLGAGV